MYCAQLNGVSLHETWKSVFLEKSEKYFRILSAKIFTQNAKRLIIK